MRLLITSASFVAKRIEAGRDTLRIGLTEFDMQHSLPVYSFHAKNSWTNKHRWLGEITARGINGVEVGCSARRDPRGVVLDLGDCFLSSLQSIRAHSTFVWHSRRKKLSKIQKINNKGK